MYFPDPWPKRKQRKRRLVQEPLLGLVYEVLEHDGLLEIVTDDEDYFREMLHSVRDGNLLWRDIRESRGGRLFEAVTKTNYELRYEAQGKTIYSLEAKK